MSKKSRGSPKPDPAGAADSAAPSAAFWKQAARSPLYRPVKTQLTVRLDADVLAWLRAAGSGYQSKLNAILRQAMLHDLADR